MKKYLFGILLLFVFLQPLTAKDLVYHSAPAICNHPQESVTESIPLTPQTQVEAVLIDVDDEDEVSETETKNNISQFVYENQTQIAIISGVRQVAITPLGLSPYRLVNQPLYLLWSVFLI